MNSQKQLKNLSLKAVTDKFGSITRNLVFCVKESWKASPVFFSIRIGIEVINAVIPVITAYMGKKVINILVDAIRQNDTGKEIQQLIQILLIVLGINFFNSILNRINSICSNMHREILGNHINISILKKTESLDISYFDTPKYQNEIINIRRDSMTLQTLISVWLSMVKAIVQLCISIPLLTGLHWSLPLLIAALNLPSTITEKRFAKMNYSWTRSRVQDERKMGYLQGILMNKAFAKEIKLFGVFNELLERYSSIWKGYFRDRSRIDIQKGKMMTLFSLLPQLGSTGISAFLGINIIYRKLTIGDYSFYNGISGQVVGGINALVTTIVQLYEGDMKINNYIGFLEWKPVMNYKGKLVPEGRYDIEFKNVTFKYPNTQRHIIKNLSFKAGFGEKIAIVGLNGAGKSTLIKLLMRFYDPDEGQILLGGTDIREFDIGKLRGMFTAVFQDFAFYALKAKDNITISDIKNMEDDEQIAYACRMSGVEQLSGKWKNGLESYMTKQFDEEGEELSGGEWQKLAIARGFFRKSANVIVLDEPTSSLDPEAEHVLFKQFTELCGGRTAFLISHRLSSVTMADRILVLEGGSVLESGSHQELMEKEGRYAQLFKLQAQKYMTVKTA